MIYSFANTQTLRHNALSVDKLYKADKPKLDHIPVTFLTYSVSYHLSRWVWSPAGISRGYSFHGGAAPDMRAALGVRSGQKNGRGRRRALCNSCTATHAGPAGRVGDWLGWRWSRCPAVHLGPARKSNHEEAKAWCWVHPREFICGSALRTKNSHNRSPQHRYLTYSTGTR